MATAKNLDWYFYMKNYNLKQMENAASEEDKEYYRNCANHWINKIRLVAPDYPICNL